MTPAQWFGASLAALVAAGSGCSSLGSDRAFDPRDLDGSSGWVAVLGVPVLRESCEAESGIAALGMIFAHWGVRGWPRERIERACPVVGGRGTRARDLRSCAREAGLEAHLVHGS